MKKIISLLFVICFVTPYTQAQSLESTSIIKSSNGNMVVVQGKKVFNGNRESLLEIEANTLQDIIDPQPANPRIVLLAMMEGTKTVSISVCVRTIGGKYWEQIVNIPYIGFSLSAAFTSPMAQVIEVTEQLSGCTYTKRRFMHYSKPGYEFWQESLGKDY